jgi:hypothetical protein
MRRAWALLALVLLAGSAGAQSFLAPYSLSIRAESDAAPAPGTIRVVTVHLDTACPNDVYQMDELRLEVVARPDAQVAIEVQDAVVFPARSCREGRDATQSVPVTFHYSPGLQPGTEVKSEVEFHDVSEDPLHGSVPRVGLADTWTVLPSLEPAPSGQETRDSPTVPVLGVLAAVVLAAVARRR